MECKRERRPNVRLEELGDFPAAVACFISISSPRSNDDLARKRWRRNPPTSSASVPPPTSWTGLPHLKSDEAGAKKPPELDFREITRKSRLTNRRGHTSMGNNRVFAGACGFRYSPGISNEDGKEEFTGHGSDSPSVDPSGGAEFAHDGVSRMNSVSRRLEGIGFGRYAGVFAMHEVDEEALPLLTIQDLKEMGIYAVGPRRKLYEAIRRVAGDQSTWLEEDADCHDMDWRDCDRGHGHDPSPSSPCRRPPRRCLPLPCSPYRNCHIVGFLSDIRSVFLAGALPSVHPGSILLDMTIVCSGEGIKDERYFRVRVIC